jgi:hypothetical protein
VRAGGVPSVVVGEQPAFLGQPRDEEEDEGGPGDDGDDSGHVGPVVALQEGRGRRCLDRVRVLRILRREVDSARIGELELALGAVGDLVRVRRRTELIADEEPAARSAPNTEVRSAPPRSRWRSAVPEAIPARCTGTEPVSECEAGVPASPTPIPMKT